MYTRVQRPWVKKPGFIYRIPRRNKLLILVSLEFYILRDRNLDIRMSTNAEVWGSKYSEFKISSKDEFLRTMRIIRFVLNINSSSNSMTGTIKDILKNSVLRPRTFLSLFFFLTGLVLDKKAEINQKMYIKVVVTPTLSSLYYQFIILMALPLRTS